jgi:hypothetical protein
MKTIILIVASLLFVAACSTSATSPAPVPASPAAMQVMAKGSLEPVDGTASGTAELVVQPNGAYEVVLEDFSTPSIAHTNIVLVSNETVSATADVDKSKLLDLGPLVSTTGMQSFSIPADMAGGVMGYHSVVIWDTEMAHAIAAASLK